MEWPTIDLKLPDSYFRFFRYGSGRSTVFRYLDSDDMPVIWRMTSNKKWDLWFEKECLLSDGPEPGLCVLICCRTLSITGQSSAVHNLPFSMPQYERLAERFQLHDCSKRMISRGVTHFSRLMIRRADGSVERIVYNARMAKSLKDDIAMVATYLPDIGVTSAVVYGCDEQQESQILDYLCKAGDSAQHPLLMAGIFVEIERKCLIDRVERLLDSFVQRTEHLRNEGRSLKQVLNSQGDRPADVLEIYDTSRDLVKYLQEVKRQLAKIIDSIQELYKLKGRKQRKGAKSEQNHRGQRFNDTGLRIRERVLDIIEEYDSKIEDCSTVLQDLTVNTQIMMSHIARRESEFSNSIAIQTKRDNAQMKAIATLTMVCLPLTSVASIFSMGVFNWNAQAGEHVLTVYFWLYVGVAGGLTVMTLAAWLILTRKSKTDSDESHRDSMWSA